MRRDADKAKGEVQIGEKKFPLMLQRVVPVPPADVKAEFFEQPMGIFWIGLLANLRECYFLDFASGRFGLVFATPAGSLILGQSLIAPFFPVRTTVSLAKTANASKTAIFNPRKWQGNEGSQ